jgi:hypothetical protein
MPHDTDSTPSAGLRTRLTALGAKPHSRMSDLSRYMLDHYEELQALVAEGFAWAAITGLLANEEQLVDKRGKPITAELAKLTWSRTMARRRGVATPRAATRTTVSDVAADEPVDAASNTADRPQAPMASRLEPESSNQSDASFAEGARPPLDIQPARLRGASASTATAAGLPRDSDPPLLSEDEVARRLDDLAKRQGGQKIPLPKPL